MFMIVWLATAQFSSFENNRQVRTAHKIKPKLIYQKIFTLTDPLQIKELMQWCHKQNEQFRLPERLVSFSIYYTGFFQLWEVSNLCLKNWFPGWMYGYEYIETVSLSIKKKWQNKF